MNVYYVAVLKMSSKSGGNVLSSKTATIAIVSGVGVISFIYFIRRILSRRPQIPAWSINSRAVAAPDGPSRPDSNSFVRQTANDPRGGLPSSGSRAPRIRHPTVTSTIPPLEADLVIELARSLERASTNLDLVRNRSDRDRNRAEMVQSVLDRLRVLETDISRLVLEGGHGGGEGDEGSLNSGWVSYQSPRAGTISVLSDDSFMSALEDFPISADDIIGEELNIDKNELHFYQLGLEKAAVGEVLYRKPRTELCQCESETEFAAKLYCLRQAFEIVLADEHRRLWLGKSGRQLLGDIMKHSKQDTAPFYKAFDDMMEFLGNERNQDILQDELRGRGVTTVSFWDALLDFILLDSFDDLKAPPSAVYSVTRNYFLSQSMKYSTISTIIWSMLKQKRGRLQYPDGFLAHFYNISESVSPAITLGFLGTDDNVRELCNYFKEQLLAFVVDIFNIRKVRYTCVQDLADDIWVQMESRTELILTRLNSELLPI